MTASCCNCKFLHRETESWEMPWIYYYECLADFRMSNLRAFPFKQTKCKKFEKREKKVPIDLTWETLNDS